MKEDRIPDQPDPARLDRDRQHRRGTARRRGDRVGVDQYGVDAACRADPVADGGEERPGRRPPDRVTGVFQRRPKNKKIIDDPLKRFALCKCFA